MFSDDSRYADLPARELETAEGRRVVYVARRMVPPAERYQRATRIVVSDTDRLDLIAHRTLGRPTAFWQIADANAAMEPAALTQTPGTGLDIPLPRLPGVGD